MSDSDETEKPISGSKKRPITGRTTEVMKKIRIQAHECGEPCGCKRLKCFEAVSSDERKHLLDYFNSLQTHDAQNLYLCGLITAMCVKQRRPVNIEAPGTRHDASYAYRVRVKKEEEFKDVPVCANAFMSMHGIGRGKLNYLKKSLITTGEAPKDKRGKSSGNHRRLHEDTLKAIKAHIGSFKTRSSHYALKDSRRQYLPEDLNIKKMYAMFKEAHEILNASYETYRNIFNTQFNIPFGYPRMDTCSFCDENRVKIAACNNEAELRKIKLEDLLHKKKAEVFYDRKRITRKTAIRDSSLVAIAMDYQKNVSLPNITTNDVYYKRQLSMNSFNIHNLVDKKSYFYAYPETHARKGSDEVYPAKMTAVTESSEIATDTCTISTAPLTGLDSDGVYQFHIVSEDQNNTNQHQCCANLEQSLAIQNVLLSNQTQILEHLNTITVLVSNQTQILEQLNTITKVKNSIVQKFALFSVQLEDAVLQMNQRTDKDFNVTELSEIRSTTYNTGFYVKRVDSIQKLNELEQQLSESSERQQLKSRYGVICSGGRGIDCAYTLVDILFSRDLLCQCTWSGGSRKDDVKIAFKSYKNILSFFWGMIHSWDVAYTIKDNESFFKNILKNSKKRQMAKNQRASTSRKRAKLSKLQISNKEDNNDEDMSDDSEKIDAVYKENSITEESEEDQYKSITTNLHSSPNRNESSTEEERAVKEMEKELNSLEEMTTDLKKKEEHGIVVNLKEKEQKNPEFTINSKEEIITEENKENIIGIPKNTDKKDNNNPKTKILKMLKKKREYKRLEKFKKIRQLKKKVAATTSSVRNLVPDYESE